MSEININDLIQNKRNLNKYLLIVEGEIKQLWATNLPNLWNDIQNFDFIHDDDFLATNNWYRYEKIDADGNPFEERHSNIPYFDPHLLFDFEKEEPIVQDKIVVSKQFIIGTNNVKEVCTLRDRTPEEIEQEKKKIITGLWFSTIQDRNSRLQSSDYLLLPDVYGNFTPEQQQQILTFRQALRDVPDNFKNPNTITWPELPSFLKKE